MTPTVDHSFSRRLFLQGTLTSGMAFGGFAQLFAEENAAKVASKQKHVILLFMSGGPSQFETWDPKPGRPTGGPHLSIPTKVPGYHIDEYLPNLARLADRMAIIRSMTSKIGDHTQGAYHVQTAHRPSRIVAPSPHWLSVCAHELPTSNEVPAYVGIGKEGDALAVPGAGFLGPRYQGLFCPGNGEPPQDLPKVSSREREEQNAREQLRSLISNGFQKGRKTDAVASHESSFQQMTRLLASSSLFDVSKEPVKDQDRYGKSRFGRDCLLARRLVERGVSFVRVQHQNGLAWDKHRRAFDSQRHISTEFDTAVGALIDDLVDRGLWDQTLLVLMGEFGRTPTIQGQGPPGRNHWTKCWSLSFGGCGIKGGVIVGSTNKDGTGVKDRPVTIPDLFCTFYRALGIRPHKNLYFQGRPIPLVEDKQGEPIKEVL